MTTTWNIDSAHSGIHFTVRHMVFAKVRGRFATWRGALQLDPASLASGKAEVRIEAASIDTGVADRDNHLRSGDFLDVERFPELRFVSKSVRHTGGDTYAVDGALTIRDATRDVTLDVTYAGQAKDPWGNQRVAFTASTSIDRREFGLAWNQVLEAGGVLVGERIEIEIELQAVQAADSAAA